jgi:4,5-DOPA dioxygenase extradiol
MTETMPTIFIGHGTPENAIRQNAWTDAWARLGRELPSPRAILAVSAHWHVPGVAVTANRRPPTVHDFGDLLRHLDVIEYPAPGSEELVQRVQALLAPERVYAEHDWGLDHGVWSVLVHMRPEADVPVVQLSMDRRRAPAAHLELARRLAPLRDEGVLVMATGNLVHNLSRYRRGEWPPPPDWAERFEGCVREALLAGDEEALLGCLDGEDARLAVPTPEHFLPLLYAVALRRAGDRVAFPTDGYEGGSVSMLSVSFGA